MQSKTKIAISAIATSAALLGSFSVFARGDKMGHGMGEGHKQMYEKNIAACQGLTEGSKVTIDHPVWGAVNAVCAPDREGKLAAMPAKRVEHHKQAIAACNGKNEGDKVSVTSMMDPSKTMEVQCVKDHNGQLIAGHGDKHHGGKGGMMH